MTLNEIIEKLDKSKIIEEREVTDSYGEFVIANKDMKEWDKLLVEILGPAKKEASANPDKEDSQLTKAYGGIFSGQTLFKKDFEGHTIIAMLWPWGNDMYTTLKIVTLGG